MAEVRGGHQADHPQGLKWQDSRKDPPQHHLRKLAIPGGTAGRAEAEVQALHSQPSLPILPVLQLRRRGTGQAKRINNRVIAAYRYNAYDDDNKYFFWVDQWNMSRLGTTLL